MTVGIRIKGTQGNIQIDDTTPLFRVAEQGTISNYVTGGYDPSGQYSGRMFIAFSFPVTTQEPPLVFLKISTPYWVMTTFTIIGVPGAWTGFAFGAGQWGPNNNYIKPQAVSGEWFTGIKTSTKSDAKAGMRVRNRLTGEVVFDSGHKLVKFIKQDSGFSTEVRLTHWILRYSVGYPPGAYFLANTLSCIINYYGSDSYHILSPSVDATFPNKMLLYTWAPDRGDGIPYQANTWNVLFATPGL